MKKLLLFACSCLCLWSASAQIMEDFNDGDWSNGVSWIASSTDWAIENGTLRSVNATDQADFQCYLPSSRVKNTQWMLWLNLKFNTSSANYSDLFLAADTAPAQAMNGYYVRIGNTKDEVSLYRLQNGVSTELISGVDGLLNTSDNTLRLRVTCSEFYEWKLEYAEGTATAYNMVGMATDSTIRTARFTGWRVKQSTASFHKKHYFDDFYCGNPILDLSPPQILRATFLQSDAVKLEFSEPVQTLSEQDTVLFLLNGYGRPNFISMSADGWSAILRFQGLSGVVQSYSLQASGFADLAGNPNPGQVFRFFGGIPEVPKPGTLVMTEVMSDPDPVVGTLPAAEYVELQNTSASYISLRGVTFSDAGSSVALPDTWLGPGERIILCEANLAGLFQPFGKVLGLSPWPSLNNSGDDLMLRDAAGCWLHELHYTTSMYGSTIKAAGGWSLEMIDSKNPCDPGNWKASTSVQGGTPGAKNAVQGNNPDFRSPVLAEVYPEDPFLLRIRFSELPDSGTLKPSCFLVGSDTALSVYPGATRDEYKLNFLHPFQKGNMYSITARAVADCAGNVMQPKAHPFMLPEQQVDSGSVIINEVLFDPYVGGEDFVELYNKSSLCLDLRAVRLANASSDFIPDQVVSISERGRMLLPGHFVALSTNIEFLKQRYPRNGSDSALLAMNELPAYNNEEGAVMLLNASGQVLDRMKYREEQHFSLINDREGVSLERMLATTPGDVADNWQSAAQEAGWATPGLPNSQAAAAAALEAMFQIEPEYFSPDMDGVDDVVRLMYRFNNPGFVLSVTIYDTEGKIIRHLCRNLYAGVEGFVKWDGARDNGTLATAGNYILQVEAFSDRGQRISKTLFVALLLRN
jgi:hypothetical protein